MNINFNFNYTKNLKINGDIRYQIDAISLLKKNNFKISLGKKRIRWIISATLKNMAILLLKIPLISNLFNKELNYISRKLSFDFKNLNSNIFSHYFFSKPTKNQFLVWSTQGVMNKIYYKNYVSLTNLKSDIVLYKKIDKFKNIIFLIWDKKFALRTRNICKLKSPIKVIPPSLNFKETELEKIKLKVNKKINILFVGSNPKIKGLDYLLKAIEDKKFDNLDFKLDVITNSNKYINSKKVKFYSNISENFKKKLLKECDIFVLPTIAETFGYSILEAISFKCAILTTNFYPLTNFCSHNVNGFLVKNKNSEDIKKYLIKLILNKKKIKLFKKNSFFLYKKKFGQKIFLKKMKNLNQEILKKKIKSDI